MNALGYNDLFRRYQQTWWWVALAPSSLVFVVALYLKCDFRLYTFPFVFLSWVHGLFALTPMLAWWRARRAILRSAAESSTAGAASSSAPPVRLSGPFPWWPVAALAALYLIDISLGARRYLVFVLCWGVLRKSWVCRQDVVDPESALTILVHACLAAFWWWCYRRDALRVAVLETTADPDGAPGLLLHTPSEMHPVQIAACDRSKRTVRLEGSHEVWHAVDSMNDLVRGSLPSSGGRERKPC
jgi:hypothetical protein